MLLEFTVNKTISRVGGTMLWGQESRLIQIVSLLFLRIALVVAADPLGLPVSVEMGVGNLTDRPSLIFLFET